MSTALSLYVSNAASATLGTANQLYTTGGTPGVTEKDTTIDASTGYGEIAAQGSTSSWPAAGSLPAPDGRGFFYDLSILDGMDIVGGNWSAIQRTGLTAATGTATADIYCRAWRYRPSTTTYTLIVTMVVTKTFAAAANTNATFASTSASSMSFAPGDKIYIQYDANVTTNGSATGQKLRLGKLSTDTVGMTGDPSGIIVTPGYQPVANTAITDTQISSASASITVAGTGTLSITETSSAFVESTIVGAGSISITENSDVSVESTVAGIVSTTITESGSVSVESTAVGVGAITVTETGSASVESTVVGAGTTTFDETSSASVESTVAGTGTLSITENSSASIESTVVGAGATTITESGSPSVETTSVGTGTITFDENSSASIESTVVGAGATTITESGSVSVESTMVGAGSISITESGSPSVETASVGIGSVSIAESASPDAFTIVTSSFNTTINEQVGNPSAESTVSGIGAITINEPLALSGDVVPNGVGTLSINESLTAATVETTTSSTGTTTINDAAIGTLSAETTVGGLGANSSNEQIGIPYAEATTVLRELYIPYPSLVNDMFQRANQSGLGVATDGNSYNVDMGAASTSIVSNQGQVTGVSALTFIREGSAQSADFDITVQCSVNSTNYTVVGVYGRQTAANTAYRARLNTNDNTIGFAIVKTIAGTSTNIASMGFTAALNKFYNIRFRAVGSNLFAKVWHANDGTLEPTSWQLTTSDTSITGPGTFGLAVNTTNSADIALFDNLFALDYSEHERLTMFDATATTQASLPANLSLTNEMVGIPYAEATTQASTSSGNVTGQQLSLSNTGTDDGTWTASSNASWLLFSPASGTLVAGDSTTISVSTNSDALAPGTYNATLTLQMSNANTVQVPVSLSVIAANSAPQSVTLTNTGGASGNWTGTVSASWLSLSTSSGVLAAGASTTVNVYVDTSSLSPGAYNASITLSIAGSNSVVVPVMVTIGATTSAAIGVAPTSLLFNGIVGGTSPNTRSATITNRGNEAGAYTSSIVYSGGASGWLALTPQTGSLPASGTQVIGFSLVNTANLPAGNYTALITFSLGSQSISMSATLVMQTAAQGSTQTVLIAEQPVTVEWPLVITNKIDEQSTADFTVLDDTGTLVIPQNAQVIINDSLEGVKFKGYVATVESNKRLYPQPHVEHVVVCQDERYVAAKRLFTGKEYINRLAGDIVADLMQGYLTPEGVSASYAIRHDNSTATFNQGTLTNTLANNDIELAYAGTGYSIAENMQSGTLLKCGVGANNALQLASTQAIKIVGSASQGVSSAAVNQIGNNYAYFKIWSGNVSIASGDSLRYGVWVSSTSPQIMSAVDGICTDGTTIRDYQNRFLLDQNHLAAHPGTDLSGYANDQWYFRTIDLTPIAGKSLGTLSVAFEGDNTGTYTSYFRAVRLLDSSGNVKQTFFDSNLASNQLLSNIGYGSTSLTQVTAYEQSGTRTSSANGIGAVGVIQTSSISWITDSNPPQGTSLTIESSIDNGATWQACTTGATLPSLLTGANAKSVIVFTRQRLGLTGPSPELTPNLYSLQWSVTPSYGCSKTDVLKIDTTQSDLSSGTNSGVLVSNGNMTLNGVWRNWSDASTANQTFFGYGSHTTVMHQAVVTVAPGGKEGRSRLDFAGSWQDFIAEVDVTVSSHGNASFVYRTTNWQTANNYHAYNVDLTQTQIILGRGSSSGVFTQIAVANVDLSKGTVFRLKVIANGSSHRIYVDDVLYINATDSTYLQSGQFGLRFLNNDSSVTYSGFFGNFGVVAALTGSHITNAISLSGVSTIGTSVIQWDADIPQGGNVTVAVSFDKTTWTPCTNGGTVPGFTNGGANTSFTLYVRTTVSSGNAAANAVVGRDLSTYLTPTVHGVTLWIASQLNALGTRVSPALQLDTVGVAGSSSVSWSQVAPVGTSVGIDISLNGGVSWTDVSSNNGGSIPGINEGDSMAGKSVVTRIREISTVPSVTPQVTDLTISVRNGDIQSGALIPSTSYAFQSKIDRCLDDLASKSNYWWAIKNGRLFFQNRAGMPAPWVLDSSSAQTINGQAIGDVLLKPLAPRLKKASVKYRNRQWIINVLTPSVSPVNEHKLGDGKTQVWQLTYPIAQGSITIARNGNPVSVGILGLEVGKDFYYTPNQSALTQNPNVQPLQAANGDTPGEVLSIVYTSLTPQPVMAEDIAQQEALADIDNTTGIIEEVEDANTLYPNGLLADAGQQLAQARLDEYATLGREWQSSTLRGGLDAGMLQTINVPEFGLINVPMLITEIKINYMPGMTRYDLTYVEGYNLKSWTNYFTAS